MLKNNFIEKSFKCALSFIKESIICEECASKKGLLQSFDPRIKIFTIMIFIIQTLLLKKIESLLFLYLFLILITCLSKINLWFFLKRTLIFIPLFSLFIAMPAIFSVFTPGETLFSFYIFSFKFAITHQGLLSACFFITRVTISVSLIMLMNLTTKHNELLKALSAFRIPHIFIMVFGMCWRYIYLFIVIIENTYLAIKSRIGVKIHYKKGQNVVAWNIAHLWIRSYQLNEQVFKAMLSRGYSGEAKISDTLKINIKDLLWLFFAAIFSTGIYVL